MFNDPMDSIDEAAYSLTLRQLSDEELSESIRKLRLILDMHIKEQAAREEEKPERVEE